MGRTTIITAVCLALVGAVAVEPALSQPVDRTSISARAQVLQYRDNHREHADKLTLKLDWNQEANWISEGGPAEHAGIIRTVRVKLPRGFVYRPLAKRCPLPQSPFLFSCDAPVATGGIIWNTAILPGVKLNFGQLPPSIGISPQEVIRRADEAKTFRQTHSHVILSQLRKNVWRSDIGRLAHGGGDMAITSTIQVRKLRSARYSYELVWRLPLDHQHDHEGALMWQSLALKFERGVWQTPACSKRKKLALQASTSFIDRESWVMSSKTIAPVKCGVRWSVASGSR